MTITDLRNAIVKNLWCYLDVPVVLANQVQPEVDTLPYIVYSVTTPYVSTGELGEYATEEAVDSGMLEYRWEMPSATFSFTACSENHIVDGIEFSGEDEAEELASKAVGYFKHIGYDDFLKLGVTVVDVGQVQDRTTIGIEEAACRKGFDVRIRYTRVDMRNVYTIRHNTITEKKE